MPKKPVVIGLIYAEWCGHCQALKPEWNLMKTNIGKKCKNKEYSSPPQYMEIEHNNKGYIDTFNKQYANHLVNPPLKYNGYPTIFRIQDDKIDYYNGSRNADVMEKWFMSPYQRMPMRRTMSKKRLFRGGRKHRRRQTRKRILKK